MKKAIVIGETNVGKSLFLINFAEFLGYRSIYITIEYPDGKVLNKQMSTKIAKIYLSSNTNYKTRSLQAINLNFPVYKGSKEVKLIDSSGLSNGIHPDINIRNSMIQTLESMIGSDLIVHIVDTSRYIDETNIHTIDTINNQIYKYGRSTDNYILVANKIDLDRNNVGFNNIVRQFNDTNVIPISALYKKGFKEVRKFVLKYI